MILYSIKSELGEYIDLCYYLEDTIKSHMKLLESNKHHCFKLQYIYNDGFKLVPMKLISLPDRLASFSKISYIQKQDYVLNSNYPVIFDKNRYTKYEMHIVKPSRHICIMRRYYDDKIMGIEIDEYGIIEEGYYKIYKDHLERLE